MKSTESQPSLSIAMPSLQNKWLWCSLTPSEQNKTEFNNRHSLLLAPKYSWKWPYVASTVYLLQYLKFTAVFEKQILLFFRYDEANRSGNDLHWGKKNSLSFTVPNRKEWSCQSEWLLSKSLQAINDGEGVEKREPCWWECRLVQLLWRTVWRFLKNLEIELPYDPAIPLLGIHTEETELKETCVPQCSSQHCLS